MECYLGEIRIFAGPYVPKGWYLCNGATIPISGNEALYALLGTQWGGDGISSFGLPDLRDRVPIGSGQGPGLTNRPFGSTGGQETVTLTSAQLPAHTHAFNVSTQDAKLQQADQYCGLAKPICDKDGTVVCFGDASSPSVIRQFATEAIEPAGVNTQPVENMMPSVTINYIISSIGEFPSAG